MVQFYEDPASRVRSLIRQVDLRFRARFLIAVEQVRDSIVLEQVADLIQAGRIEEALRVTEVVAFRLSALWAESYTLSGSATAAFVGGKLSSLLEFDATAARAAEQLRRNQLRLVQGLRATQREATEAAILDGINRGLNPLDQARGFRASIGLTPYQQQIVANYRTQLATLNPGLFDRRLRDRRFDSTVRRAIESGKALSPEQIERMVERYRERWVKYRSEVIARTEALRSIHAGNEEMYRQAVEAGTLDPDDIERTWDTSDLPNVRASHRPMEGQVRGFDEPFEAGDGELLRYPGDENASAHNTAQCVCSILTRFSDRARESASAGAVFVTF